MSPGFSVFPNTLTSVVALIFYDLDKRPNFRYILLLQGEELGPRLNKVGVVGAYDAHLQSRP